MKYDLEKVRQMAAAKGHTLLEEIWVNKRTKMRCRCGCGNECSLTLDDINRDAKCKECTLKSSGEKKGYTGRWKISTEEAKAYFASQGCELLEDYKGFQTPMLYRCMCGKEATVRWDHFLKRGHRCGCIRKTKTVTLEDAKKVFADNQCELLATEYTSCTEKMPFRCKCGKVDFRSYSVMKNNPKSHCWECGNDKKTGPNSCFYIKDRDALAQRNKFKKRCYRILEHTLDMVGKKKNGHTYDLLGYRPSDLQNHIEQHPNWPRVKDSKWHLDHIFPIKAFTDHGIHDIKLINSLDNLQPTTQRENNVKHAKYDVEEFKAWLESKGFGEALGPSMG